ncbi:ERI1 exoribonuclease 2-like isoform X2 [Liolophura sinensis]|uniref:ERI1 exoribonuclease 2-like isoform X2 n=1 Tax=Liolophura sinensis TaxID=3198878 RepID=UPI00315872DF
MSLVNIPCFIYVSVIRIDKGLDQPFFFVCYREMGLLRRRSKAEGPAVRGCVGQLFQYLVVIDFESTCWKDQKFRTQEIIEFPAVLLNTSSGICESEFHFYVQPCEQPVLSDFCKQLTGITQAQVEDGIPLSLCMKKFGHWIEKLNREKNVLFNPGTPHPVKGTFVTWSDWDLSVCLQYECKRKQIMKPAYLNSWIDLRATYRNFYSRKPNGLNGALQDLGIEFSGRQHSGVDDARNTAHLAWRMMRDGCILNVTKTIKELGRGSSVGLSVSAQEKSPGRTSDLQPADDMQDTSVLQLFKRPLPPVTSCLTSPSLRSPVRKQPRVIPNSLSKSSTDSDIGATSVKCDRRAEIGRFTVSTLSSEESRISESTVFKKPKSPVSSKPVNMPFTKTTSTVLHRPDNTVFTKPASAMSSRSGNAVFTKQASTVSSSVPRCSENAAFSKPANAVSSRSVNAVFTKPASTVLSRSENAVFKKPACSMSNRSGETVFAKPACAVSSRSGNKIFTNKAPVSNTSGSDNVLLNRITKQYSEPRSVADLKSKNMLLNAKLVNTPGCKTSGSTSCLELDKENQVPSLKQPSPSCVNSTSVNRNRTPSPLYKAHQMGMVTPVAATRPLGESLKCWSSASITPPLCLCGKRSKRRLVQSPGPNQGRCFYSCPSGRRPDLVQSKKSAGCQFFKWETILSKGQTKFAPAPSRNAMSTGLLRRHTSIVQPDNRLTASCNKHLRKSNLPARPSLHMR